MKERRGQDLSDDWFAEGESLDWFADEAQHAVPRPEPRRSREPVTRERHAQPSAPQGTRVPGYVLPDWATGRNRVYLAAAACGLVAGVIAVFLMLGGKSGTPGVTTDPLLATSASSTTGIFGQTTTGTTTTASGPNATGKIVVAAGASLRAGSSGPMVKRLQVALRSLGLDPGTADGAFGAATEQAVRAFQTAHGVTADGVVGPATAATINDALAALGTPAATTATVVSGASSSQPG